MNVLVFNLEKRLDRGLDKLGGACPNLWPPFPFGDWRERDKSDDDDDDDGDEMYNSGMEGAQRFSYRIKLERVVSRLQDGVGGRSGSTEEHQTYLAKGYGR